jgi:hypothetical protein
VTDGPYRYEYSSSILSVEHTSSAKRSGLICPASTMRLTVSAAYESSTPGNAQPN